MLLFSAKHIRSPLTYLYKFVQFEFEIRKFHEIMNIILHRATVYIAYENRLFFGYIVTIYHHTITIISVPNALPL